MQLMLGFDEGNQLAHLSFSSSRRRHTRFSRDWSSAVCSSDLPFGNLVVLLARQTGGQTGRGAGGQIASTGVCARSCHFTITTARLPPCPPAFLPVCPSARLAQLPHGQELEDPVLDVLEGVVILLQDP